MRIYELKINKSDTVYVNVDNIVTVSPAVRKQHFHSEVGVMINNDFTPIKDVYDEKEAKKEVKRAFDIVAEIVKMMRGEQ